MAIKPPWAKKGSKEPELPYYQKNQKYKARNFTNVDEFDLAVDEFFEYCYSTFGTKGVISKWPTLHGLFLWLGFYDQRSWEKFLQSEEGAKYEDSMARARAMVADCYEQRLHGTQPTGAIFALKNMGWADNQRRELSGSVQVTKVERTIVDPEHPDS